MKTVTKESVTFRFNDEELVDTIAHLMDLKDYCDKKGEHDDLVKDLQTAIDVMEWAFCELFGEEKE